MNILRILIASFPLLLASGSLACKHSPVTNNTPAVAVQTPLATPTDASPDLKAASEIELRRSNSDYPYGDSSLILHRGAGDIFADASVVRTNLYTKKNRTGRLSAYYYNHLIQLITSQGVFDMDNQYAMGTFDATVVKLNVSFGDRHKTILTSSEGDVPLKLWGLYMAIDGAAAQTEWNDAK